MTNGTFELLCSNPVVFLQNNASFDRVKGVIQGNKLFIESENALSSDAIDWLIMAERKDEFIKAWDKTNADGYLVTEHDALPI